MSIISLTLNVNLATAKMGTPIDVFVDKIIGVATLQTAGTVIIANGGAAVPVKESKEQIYDLINKSKNSIETINQKGDLSDGTTTATE